MRFILPIFLIAPLMTACALGDDVVDGDDGELEGAHHHGSVDQEPPYYDEKADGLGTVRSQIGRCTTAGIRGLNEQIVEQINCLVPNTLARVPENTNLRFMDGSVLPYLTATAYPDLLAASSEGRIEITSGYRTVVQQLMIYKWRQARRCGIKAAARPSTSDHESGMAIDVGNYASAARVLRRHRWRQTVPGDDVHFEHQESLDLGHIDVLAFQMLWNRNHPEDPIDEDADYDQSTERALLRAPAAGFPLGPICQ